MRKLTGFCLSANPRFDVYKQLDVNYITWSKLELPDLCR